MKKRVVSLYCYYTNLNIINMKKYIVLLFLSVFTLNSNAQMDTLSYGIFNLSPEIGMFYPRNEYFQGLYNAKSVYTYSLGFDFGKSTWTYHPWFRYTTMNVENGINGVPKDSITISASKKEYAFGIMRPYRISSNDYIQLKLGITYNSITETYTSIDQGVFGYVFSVGYLHRIDKYVSYYMDLGSDYARVNSGYQLRDWSGFRFDIGISINLGVGSKDQHPVFVIP